MVESAATPVARERPVTIRFGAALALVVALGGCGGSSETAADAAPAPSILTPATTVAATTLPPSTSPTTTLPAVTSPPTTSTPAPTTAPTSTTTTTTLVAQQTEPIDPPADARGAEPEIEMGTLAIPKLGIATTMYEGIRLTTLDRGPGHWPGSALPGENGNVVVGGHRTSKNRVFRDVDRLEAGDEIVFTDDRGEHVYLVNRVEIVGPDAMWIVDPTDTPTVTLFACHPPGSTAQRIVVFADLASTG